MVILLSLNIRYNLISKLFCILRKLSNFKNKYNKFSEFIKMNTALLIKNIVLSVVYFIPLSSGEKCTSINR
jgi:hypothetical protein